MPANSHIITFTFTICLFKLCHLFYRGWTSSCKINKNTVVFTPKASCSNRNNRLTKCVTDTRHWSYWTLAVSSLLQPKLKTIFLCFPLQYFAWETKGQQITSALDVNMFEIRPKLQILPDEGEITCGNHKQKRLQLSNSLHTAISDFITSPPCHYC